MPRIFLSGSTRRAPFVYPGRRFTVTLLAAFVFAVSPFAPKAQAYEWEKETGRNSVLDDRAFAVGPAWLMNALPGYYLGVRLYVLDRSDNNEQSIAMLPAWNAEWTPEIAPAASRPPFSYFSPASVYVPRATSRTTSTTPTSTTLSLTPGTTLLLQPAAVTPNPPVTTGLTINYDFTPNVTVPDNGQITQTKTLGGLDGLSNFTNVVARINLTTGNGADPMFLGDMYSTLTFGSTLAGETTRTAVLLNRPGRDNTDPFGSSLSSLNVSLDDSVALTNIWATTSSTGTYNSDGRLGVDPHGAGVAFSNGDRNNTLAALNGSHLASNRVVLLVSDTDSGGTATLSNWGISVTGTAASSGTFTPGAGATLSDPSSSAVNNIGATLNVTGADGGSLPMNFAGSSTFAGGIVGTGGITLTGSGTVILPTANTYTGNTTVNAGTLLVSNTTGSATGSGNVTLNGNGTLLGGTGIITGSVTAGNTAPGVIINPGPVGTNGTAGSVGTLTVGALTLTGANTLHIDASGTLTSNWDKLVASAVSLGSTSTLQLSIASGLTFGNGSQYTLISNTSANPISGTFAGIAEGGIYTFNGYDFSATYMGGDGNDFALTAVPEPATWIGALLALIAIAFTQRRLLHRAMTTFFLSSRPY